MDKSIGEYLDTLRPFGEGPFEWRHGQKEAIMKMLENLEAYQNNEGKQVLELSAPTASGKSVILWAFAKTAIYFGMLDRVVITTPQRVLVDQYAKERGWFDVRDSKGFMKGRGIVLGRANYTCALDSECTADACTCRSPGERKQHPECGYCEYERQKKLFNEAEIGLTTMAYYLVGYAPQSDHEAVVIDESAGLEGNLLERYSLKIPPDPEFDKMDLNQPEEMRKMTMKYMVRLTTRKGELEERLRELAGTNDSGEKKKVAKQLRFVDNELGKCEAINEFVNRGEAYFVAKEMKISPRDAKVRGQPENEKTMIRKFKLVFGKNMFRNRFLSTPDERKKRARAREQYEEDKATGNLDPGQRAPSFKLEYMVLASGTPTTYLLTEDFKTVEMEHPIDIDRRTCLTMPVGSMAMKSRHTTIPKMARRINELHEKYAKGKHTMVHCHSYDIANQIGTILNDISNANVITQRKERDELVSREQYKDKWIATPDSIFLSVAWNEGLDLKGPEYPLNIIVKVPFAYLGDGWVVLRDKCDGGEFNTAMAAVAIQQAAGRTTRDPKDYSKTYFLDSDFGWWSRKNARFLEPWFKEAIQRAEG